MATRQGKIDDIVVWETAHLTFTNAEWIADCQQDQLRHRTAVELAKMEAAHSAKQATFDALLAKYTTYPDRFRSEIEDDLVDQGVTEPTLSTRREALLTKDTLDVTWKAKRLAQITKRLQEEQRLRSEGRVTRVPR